MGREPKHARSALALALAVVLLVLAACSGSPSAPVVERAQPAPDRIVEHIVAPGETLYSIAWSFGLDWHHLAALNALGPPYLIRAGQRLRLAGKIPAAPVPPARRAETAKMRPDVKPAQTPVKRPVAPVVPALATGSWKWPAPGRVIQRYSTGARPHKGVDLAGTAGDPVTAANNGTVVYAGTGIRGYGNLLIVKHSNDYLSAYAHNRRLLVDEGASVRTGQRIAEIGNSGTDAVKLHFEVRRSGKPIDPVSILPKR